MKFLRFASSFLNNSNSSDSTVKSIISMAGGLFSAPMMLIMISFIIPLVCFFVLINLFSYELNLFQMVDHSGGDSNDVESPSTCANKAGTTRILFIGNSRTYVADIPDKVKGFAEAGGYRVDITAPNSSTDGGKLLRELFTMKADQLEKSYDCVVMQEQSDTYMGNYSAFLEGATSIANKVKSVNSNVKTYIRQTWTTSQYINLNQAYENAEKVASATNSYLIYDGKAFEKSKEDYKGITLFGDSIHQNHNGAYLSAAVIYEKLFGKNVKNSSYTDGISGSDAANLKKVAAEFAPTSGKGSLTAEQRQKIVAFAEDQFKKRVKYNYGAGGACGGGLASNDIPDQQLSCNGLVRWAYHYAGVEIPVSSYEQIEQAPVVTSEGKVSDMAAGDVIVFDDVGRRSDIKNFRQWSYRHVAIYIGDGELIEGTCPYVNKRSIGDNEYSYSVTW